MIQCLPLSLPVRDHVTCGYIAYPPLNPGRFLPGVLALDVPVLFSLSLVFFRGRCRFSQFFWFLRRLNLMAPKPCEQSDFFFWQALFFSLFGTPFLFCEAYRQCTPRFREFTFQSLFFPPAIGALFSWLIPLCTVGAINHPPRFNSFRSGLFCRLFPLFFANPTAGMDYFASPTQFQASFLRHCCFFTLIFLPPPPPHRSETFCW